MPLTKYLAVVERMHELIRRKSTGSPNEFAQKMNLSRSMLMNYLKEMKEMGAPVCYSYDRCSYYYETAVELNPIFERTYELEEN